MLNEKIAAVTEDMKDDSKEKQLLNMVAEGGKPFMRKCDGYAYKAKEDKEIKYKDYDGNELTLAVPEGAYIVVDADCNYPKIVTSEDFESKNEMLSEPEMETKKEKKEKKGPKIGISAVSNSTY